MYDGFFSFVLYVVLNIFNVHSLLATHQHYTIVIKYTRIMDTPNRKKKANNSKRSVQNDEEKVAIAMGKINVNKMHVCMREHVWMLCTRNEIATKFHSMGYIIIIQVCDRRLDLYRITKLNRKYDIFFNNNEIGTKKLFANVTRFAIHFSTFLACRFLFGKTFTWNHSEINAEYAWSNFREKCRI